MIKAKGIIKLSKDGGKTWLTFTNRLVQGFYNTLPNSDNAYVVIGSSNTPPAHTDVGLTGEISSSSSPSDGTDFRIEQDNYVISTSFECAFNTGLTTTVREIGLKSTSNILLSRSLIRDGEGNPITLDILPEDHLIVIYAIEYYLPKAPFPVIINIDGVDYESTMTIGNPNKWEVYRINRLINTSSVGVAPLGTFTRVDDYFDGTFLNYIKATTRGDTTSSTQIQRTHTIAAGLDEFNTTFGQITLSRSSFIPAEELLAVIDLPQEVTKTGDYQFTVSFTTLQVAEV
jgi:hypothetical protein